ncbi:MAG: branched-chain amino acid transport system substrate-binding protein [Solirubrobacteraceae bacterium]|jgi:branched-chain amino acid transport system substrate-binding protein|nr:branched-chain amino acid transport system substrate-binding protein [Solirubrobacteraceae bacterium]
MMLAMVRLLVAVLVAGSLLAGLSRTHALAPPARAATSSGVVDVYSSLPLRGVARTQAGSLVSGIELALSAAGGVAGNFAVNYQSLDDSTARAGTWNPATVLADARTAAQDSKAVLYIGEFNSGASKLAIPILNQAGIAEVSPSNTYVGLTSGGPGSAPGEPEKFYPTGSRNFLRIIPNDKVQAAALLATMKSDHCARVAVANDGDTYGRGVAALIESQKRAYEIKISSNTRINPSAGDFRAYARKITARRANCFVFSGIVAHGGVQITKDVAAALPKAKIYGPDGMCVPAWTNAAFGGVGRRIAKRIQCTVATLDVSAYPGGNAFLAAYRAKYGSASPDPYAVYGYEAMKLGLDTIAALGADGSDKSAVIAALFATKNRASVLGTYGFDANGDTTLKAYGLYRPASDGNLIFERTVLPSR